MSKLIDSYKMDLSNNRIFYDKTQESVVNELNIAGRLIQGMVNPT